MNAKVIALFISPTPKGPMKSVEEVKAKKGRRLENDRFCIDKGPGDQHVTLINGLFFENSGFNYADSRRNIVTEGISLMPLIRKEFLVGEVLLRGTKYCDLPDSRSSIRNGGKSFRETFSDRGGLIAVVVRDGVIKVGDDIVTI